MATTAAKTVHLASGLVSLEDFAEYHFAGALCVRGVIDMSTVEMLRTAAAEAIEAHLVQAEAHGVPRPSSPHFHVLRRVYEQDERFRKVLFESKAPEVARDLMQSRKVIVFADSLFSKEPGAEIPTPWHHDLPFWSVRGEQVCTTWIALDHVSKASGAIEYIRGSHRWGRMFRPKYPKSVAREEQPYPEFEEIPDFDSECNRHEIISWDLAPGDMLIHQGLTVHGAGENTLLDLQRRAYAPRFVGDRAWWEPAYHTDTARPEADRLAKGDPVDRYGVYPVALDLDTPLPTAS